jgi:methionyl-tRNA synthetase
MAKQKYYVTTGVYDAAAPPSLGSVYTAILADAIARHRRMCAFDVAHLVAADVHGHFADRADQPSADPAAAAFQQNFRRYKDLLELADVHNTHSQRTYATENIAAVQTVLRRALRRSRLMFYSGRAAETDTADRYFFKLSAFQGRLRALCTQRPQVVQPPTQLAEARAIVGKGPQDIPLSYPAAERRGDSPVIPWPTDPGHFVSDWFAQMSCYLTGVGFGEGDFASDDFSRIWPANTHVVGPDALASHAIFWPSFLMAADLPLPYHIVVHGKLTIAPGETESSFLSQPTFDAFTIDAVRYFLLATASSDMVVSSAALADRSRKDLARLAHLAARVHSLVMRQCDGQIPERSLVSSVDPTIELKSADTRPEVRFALDNFDFTEALTQIWSLVESIENLLAANAGYENATDAAGRRRFKDVLSDCCRGLALVSLLLHPVMPRSTAAIWRAFGQETLLADQLIDETPWNSIRPGKPLSPLAALFAHSPLGATHSA